MNLNDMHEAGLISREQLRKIAERHVENCVEMDKQANDPMQPTMQPGSIPGMPPQPGPPPATPSGPGFGDHMRNAVMVAGAAAGANLLARGASSMFRDAKDSLTRGKDYQALMQYNPRLQDMESMKVQRAYHTVRKLMPDIASDPILAGPVVQQIVSFGGEAGLDTYQNMLNIQRGVTGNQPDSMLAESMSAGMGEAAKTVGKNMMDQGDPDSELKRRKMVAETNKLELGNQPSARDLPWFTNLAAAARRGRTGAGRTRPQQNQNP